jgi:dynein heavy chain 2
MNPSSTLGRAKISTRFTANVRLCYMDYPNAEELLPAYAEFMKTILTHPRFGNGSMANSSKRLSTFLIDLYTQVKQKFSVDEHRHYLFTPRDITTMIFSMLRYEIPEAQTLIEILIYESNRVFKDRLVDREQKKKFDGILYGCLKNHLKYQEKLIDTYFISLVVKGNESLIPGLPSLGRIGKTDFVSMVESAMRAYEREFKELDIHLIEEVLDMIAYIERVLSMPGGCLLLAGRSGIGRKPAT